MGDAVGRIEVVQRSGVDVLLNDGINFRSVSEGEEYRARLRADRLHKPGPIVLLVGSGLLVPSDHVVGVVVDVAATDDPRLAAAVHDEPV